MKRALMLLGILLLLSGCGEFMGTSSSCSHVGSSGTCKLKRKEISGDAYQHKIEVNTSASSVDVTARVSTQSGALNVWFMDPRGGKITGTVKPGQTGVIGGRAGLEDDFGKRSFKLYMEPVVEGDS